MVWGLEIMINMTVYGISIFTLAIIGILASLGFRKYYKKYERLSFVLVKVEKERQRLQQKYEGKISPISFETFKD